MRMPAVVFSIIIINSLTKPAELFKFICYCGVGISEQIPHTLNEESNTPAHVGLASRCIGKRTFTSGDGNGNVIYVDADVANVVFE